MTNEDETKAMSRLLTRGAKMLQQGCDDCGNPLFRYQGDVVCPVCREREKREGQHERDETETETGTETTETKTKAEKETEIGVSDDEESDAKSDGAWRDETESNLRELARRLSSEAADEDDLSRVADRLDALERTVELIEKIESKG